MSTCFRGVSTGGGFETERVRSSLRARAGPAGVVGAAGSGRAAGVAAATTGACVAGVGSGTRFAAAPSAILANWARAKFAYGPVPCSVRNAFQAAFVPARSKNS